MIALCQKFPFENQAKNSSNDNMRKTYLPGNRIMQGTFGRITSAQDPRILQFALKVRF